MFRRLCNWFKVRHAKTTVKQCRKYRPCFESLESRVAPALLTVNSIADNTATDNLFTFREALAVVNGSIGRALTAGEQAQITGTLGSNDTIQFSLSSGPRNISLTGGPLSITKAVTVNGPGAGNLTISANNLGRVVIVGHDYSKNLSLVASINGLTIAGGMATATGASYGGGLLTFGTVAVSNVTFTNNTAGSSGGGGIYNVGNLTVTNCTFTNDSVISGGSGAGILNNSSGTLSVSGSSFSTNSSLNGGQGGGISNSGIATVSDCTFTNNNVGSNGAGIHNSGSGNLTINNSTFTGGTATSDGGAFDSDGTATVSNCTFVNNTCGTEGGAIDSHGATTIINSTFFGNSAGSRGGAINADGLVKLTNCTLTSNRVTSTSNGGAILAEQSTSLPQLFNTIVAGNFQGASPSTTANDISGIANSTGADNIIGTGGSGGLSNGVNGNQVGVSNTLLGSLANNGGPTQTIALLSGSPAIDHGSNTYVTAGETDQRGFTRTVNSTVDIGAFEVQAASAVTSYAVAGYPSAATAGVSATFTVTAKNAQGNTVTNYNGTVHFTSTDPLAVLPADYTFVSADNGVHTFNATFQAYGGQSVTATDTALFGITGTQSGIQVNSASATTLSLTGFPSPTTAGTQGTFTVTAKLALGNTATGYRGTVHFVSSDPLAVLPADYTFTSADSGAHTFTGTLKTAGSVILAANDLGNHLGGSQEGIVVQAAAASTFKLAFQPIASPNVPRPDHVVIVVEGNQAYAGHTVDAPYINSLAQAGALFTNAVSVANNSQPNYLALFSGSTQGVLDDADYSFNGPNLATSLIANQLTFGGYFENMPSVGYTGDQTNDYVRWHNPVVSFTNVPGALNMPYTSFPTDYSQLPTVSLVVPSEANDMTLGDGTVAQGDAWLQSNFSSYAQWAQFHNSLLIVTSEEGDVNIGNDQISPIFYGPMVVPGSYSENISVYDLWRTLETMYGLTDTGASTSPITDVWNFGPPSTIAGVPGTVSVTPKDTYGNVATNYTGTVTLGSSDGQASFVPASYTFLASDAGMHTFSATLRTAGSQSITATDSVHGISGTQNGIQVQPSTAAGLAISAFPTLTTAGVPHTITISARDAFGDIAPDYTGTVTLSSSDPQAAFSPISYVFTAADAGVHTFTVTLKTVGTQSITATDASHNFSVSQSGIAVTPGAASVFLVAGYPPQTAPGASHLFSVNVRDAYNNVATNYTGTVVFSSSDSQAGFTPPAYTFTAADAGTHAFSAILNTIGTQSLTAIDSNNSTVRGSQTGIAVSLTAATNLVVSGYPAPTTAGVAHTFTVTARDGSGNIATSYTGTVVLTTSDAQGTVTPLSYTFTPADAGVHTFSATLKTASSQSISVSDSTYNFNASQIGISVVPAAASSLIVSGYPSVTAPGVEHTFKVTAKDPFGNIASGYTGSITLSSSDPQAVFAPTTYTFNTADPGPHTLYATFSTAGAQTIIATDAANNLNASQTGIVVSQTAVASLVVTGYPTPTTAGAAHTFTVTAKDSLGATVTSYTGTLHFTSSDPQAVLPADYTFTAADNGAHTFSATLKTAGTVALVVTDQVLQVVGRQNGIVVSAAAASSFSVGFQPATSPAVPRPDHVVVVSMENTGYSNLIGNYPAAPYLNQLAQGSASFTNYFAIQHPSQPNYLAVFSGSTQGVNDDNDYSFSGPNLGASLIANQFTLGEYSEDLPSVGYTGDHKGDYVRWHNPLVSFSNVPASANMPFTSFPSDYSQLPSVSFVKPNQAHDMTEDNSTIAAGNAWMQTYVSGYAQWAQTHNSLLIIFWDESDDLSPTLQVPAIVYGPMVKPGNYSETVSHYNLWRTLESMYGLNDPGANVPAITDIWNQGPAAITAGQPGNFTVTAKDAFGNIATGYTGTATLSSSDAQAGFPPANYTFTAADAGAHSFSVTLKTAGSQTITATDAAHGLSAAQTGIAVSPAAGSNLIVSGYSTPTTAGAAHSFTVTAKDAFGNIATGYTGTVAFGSSDGQAAFTPASYTFAASDAGVHSFSATLKTAGTQSLTASDTINNISGGQTGITVVSAAAASLTVAGFPTPTTAGIAHTFTVTAKDAFGNVATGYLGTVSLSSNDSQAGFAPVSYSFTAADAGAHTFSATLKTSGTQSITATDAGNSFAATESGISVVAAAAASLLVTGYPTPTTAGVAHSFTVTAKDTFGNIAAGYTGNVVLLSSDGQANFAPASYAFTAADGGTHAFSATLKTAGSQSVTVADALSGLIGSQLGVVVTPAAVSSLVVSGYPTPTTAGVAHTFTVTAKDIFGNTATGYTGSVTLSSSDGQASFSPATYTFTSTDAGTHLFSATLKTVGAQSLTATDAANTLTASQGGIAVVPAAAANLILAGYPTPTTAGVAHSYTLTAKDAFGNLATGYVGTVAFSSSDGQVGFAIPSFTFTAADAGVHNFTATLKTAGTQSLTATDAANSLTASQTGISVAPASASSLFVSGYPIPTTAGVAHTFTVVAKDAFGNTATGYSGSVTFSSGDGQATFAPANYGFTLADAGAHVFSATFRTAGSQLLTATDAADSLVASQSGITVTSASASSLVLSGYPTPTTAGVGHTFTVVAKDAFGNTATSYLGTVTLSSSDLQASFAPASYTFLATDAGTHAFSAALKMAGTQSLTATDLANSFSGSQTGISVTPASAASLTVASFPSSTTAGTTGTFTVTAKDAFGNTATGYTGVIAFSSSDAQAAFTPTNYSFTAVDAGVHTFSAALKTAGTQSLIATDASHSLSASQTGIIVTPATASSLVLSGFPLLTTAGMAQSFTVTAKDAFGNIATGYSASVSFGSSDNQATFSPTGYTFTATDAGMHSFSATLKTAGAQSLTATDAANNFSASQSGITVAAATASSFIVGGYPTPTTAGVAHSFAVTAEDAFGNIATGYSGSVALTSADGQAGFNPTNYTFTTADAGVHNFSATLKTVGTQSLTVTDAGHSLSASQSGIVVNPAAASSLSVSGYTTPTVAGTVHSFTVTAKDPFGNIATDYTGTVAFGSSDGQAAFSSATYTFVAADAGVHSFSAALKTAGSQSLTATDASNSLVASQTGIFVTAASASSLVVSGYPTPTTAGVAHTFTVTAKDAFGNTATGYTGSITLTSSDGQAAFSPANYTFTSGDAGSHTFSASLKTAGSQSLTASDAVNSLVASQTNSLVTSAAASSLALSGYSTPTTAGVANPFTLTAKDSFGNTATGFTGSVSLSSNDGQASFTLTNYTFSPADAGTHTFSAALKTAGSRSITATDAGDNLSASQTGIIVVPAVASNSVVSGFPTLTIAGATSAFTLVARDTFGNTATGYTGTVTFSSSDNLASFLPATYTFTTADAGVHAFSATLQSLGSQSLTASDVVNNLSGSQSGILVTGPAASLVVTGYPASITAGAAGSFTVTATDALGNTAIGYTGTLTFSSSDGQASFTPASYTFTAGDAGVHTFSATLKTAGSQSITATDTNNSLIASQSGVVVKAAAASSLAVAGFPLLTTAGVAGNFSVTALDAFGNIATGYTGTVTIGSNDSQASFTPASYTFTGADAGAHTFSATLRTAGNASLSALDSANSLTASQTGIVVTPTAAASLVVAGYPTPTTAGMAHSFTVTARDAFGNTATGYTGTVTFGSSDGQASFSPTSYNFTASDAGSHIFSATLMTAGSQSITASDSINSLNASQNAISVSAAPASSMSLTAYPTPTTAGVVLSVTVTLKDAFGNVASGYTGTVTLGSSDGQASISPSNYAFTAADAGIHTFSATLKTAGAQSLTATDAANSLSASEPSILVTPAVAANLVVAGFPTPIIAGVAGNLTVTARDAFGNIATGYVGTVSLSSSDIQAVFTPATYTFTSGDAGVHSFSATLKTAGAQSLVATDTANSLINGIQTGILVTPPAATTLVITGFPALTKAAAPGSFAVVAKDAFGNTATGYTGTVTFSSSDSLASFVPATYTFTTADAGVHAFSATLQTLGSQSLTASDAVNNLGGSQSGILVTGPATSLVVTGYPTLITAGAAGSFTVTATDALGNTAIGYTGTLTFSSSDGQASFTPASYTFTAGDAGVHTFSATLKTAGSQSITATDASNNLIASQSGVLVKAAAASGLAVAGFPLLTTAGVAGNFSVTALDAFGNIATGYTGTVTIGSNDSQASFTPASYTFTGADAGAHTFSATLRTAGNASLSASDSANSLTASQTGIVVTPTAAASLVVTGYPTPTTAGMAHSFTVTAKDAFGNTATGYTGTVTFGSSDGQASFPLTSYTFTNTDAGIHSLSATLKTAGAQSLTASDAASSLSATQSGIAVVAASASSLVIFGYPAPTTAGVAHSFTVTAKDAFGNTATGYTGTVAFSSSDGQASFAPASYTFTAADAGTHTLSATLRTAGSQSLTASDTVNSLSVSQSGIVVTAASVASLVVTGYASPTTAGVAHDFTVTAKDAFGNTATGYTGTVTFSSSDLQASFAPTSYTFVSADAGVHTISAILKTAGSQSLAATDSVSSLTASQNGIVVTPAAAASLVVASYYPTPTTAGVAHNFTVTAKDAFGNTATGYTGTVTFSSSDLQASFAPTSYTFVSADAGVHAISATLKTAGSQSLTATDAVNSLTASQSGIVVTPASAAILTVSGYVATTTAGVAHSFTVTARDAFGNTATGYIGTVTISSSDAQASFAPASYTFVSADSGIHTFSATLKTAGTQSLTATDAVHSLTSSQTGIVVTAANVASLVVTGYASPTTAGVAHDFTVTAKDAFGNTATGYTGTVTFGSSDLQASFAPTSYTFVSADAGVHTISATLKTAGSQSLTATDAASSLIASQNGIVVTPATAASLVVVSYPTPTTAGVAHNFTVTAKDAFGNTATGYTGTVTFSSSDLQASFAPTSYTFVSADAGVHTISATLKTAGTQSLTATDSAHSLAGSQTGIVVTSAAAASLVLAGYATPTTAGVAHSITVTAKDSFGNIATGYTGAVTLSSSDAQASFAPPSYTFVSADAGVHTFSSTLKTAGTQSLTATDSAHTLTASQTGIVVTPAAAASLVVTGYPTPTTVGVAHNFTVTAKDAFANIATGYTGAVTITSSDAQATLTPASYTFTAVDAGVHTFSATFKTVGTQSLTAKDSVTTSITGSQTGITVATNYQAVITVNSVADNTTSDSSLTLREAILYLNGTLGRSLSTAESAQVTGTVGTNNAIQFNLPSGAQTITLSGGALQILKNVSITGPGSSLLTISGNSASRVFVVGQIYTMNLNQVVSVSGVTVTKGSATSGSNNYGAGILNFGTLTVSNSAFTSNAAGASGGGGIYNDGNLTVTNSTFTGNTVTSVGAGAGVLNVTAGTLTVTGCTFTSNAANSGSSGGGISNSGTASVSSSTFTNNTSTSNGAGIHNSSSGNLTVNTSTFSGGVATSDGGGIDSDGTITVTNSTFSNNSCSSEGGAIDSHGSGNISNSTFVGNSAVSRGGAINGGGIVTLTNCTITGNRVTSSSGTGGGLLSTSPAVIYNTIIAGNFRGASPSTTANDIGGTVNSSSAYDLVGTGGSGGMTNGTNGNQVGVSNPGLGTLADNGGPTQTVALLAGSPAINHGNNIYVTAGTTDQRGLLRIVNSVVDIGAFEVQ